MLNKALNDSASVTLVNKYINSKIGIKNYLLSLVQRGDQDMAISEVYTSIYWF